MKQEGQVELVRTDLATYLGQLAENLRGVSLALAGVGGREGTVGDPTVRALVSLGASLEDTGTVLDAISRGLCQECRLREVSVSVRLEGVQKRGRKRG